MDNRRSEPTGREEVAEKPMDDYGEYESCSYCGKTIMSGVAQCPYCKNYTDDEGPRGLRAKRPMPRWFLLAGLLALVAMALFIGLPSFIHWLRGLTP